MRSVVAILLLAVVSSAAWADWEKVASAVNSIGYVDRTTILTTIPNNDSVTMRILIDYRKPPFDGNNLPYLSLTMRNEYHCKERKFRVLAIVSHTDHMGGGDRPYKTDEPSEWEAVAATSIQKTFWEVACGKSSARKE